MKKSYHSMTVPTTLAQITSRRLVLRPSRSPPICSMGSPFPVASLVHANLTRWLLEDVSSLSSVSQSHLRRSLIGSGWRLHQGRPLLDRLNQPGVLREPSTLPSGRWRCPSGFSGVEDAILDEQLDDATPEIDLDLVPLLEQREGTTVGRLGHHLTDD